jgi:hypothetical protein
MANYFNRFIKFTYNFTPILHNRIILYLFVAVALFELVYYLNIKDMFSFSSLILIGILTSFFNKNMIVILFTSIIFTHILKYGPSSYSEGMDTMDNNEDDEDEEDSKKSDSTDNVVDELSKIKSLSEKINKFTKDDKKGELIENLQDIKDTRDKIVENVQNMQPLLKKFQGYVEKYKDYKNSTSSN